MKYALVGLLTVASLVMPLGLNSQQLPELQAPMPNGTPTCNPKNPSNLPLAQVLAKGHAAASAGRQAEMYCWVYIASKMGDASAEGAYANMLQNGGFGIEPDMHLAYLWDRKAAQQGNAYAAYDLAVAYAKGNGVEKDLGKGHYWLAQAMKNPEIKADVDQQIAQRNEASSIMGALLAPRKEERVACTDAQSKLFPDHCLNFIR